MLRIAIVVERFPSVSETFITNKVLNLCKRGHQVTVFTHRITKGNELYKLYDLQSIHNLTIIKPALPINPLQWLKLVASKPSVFLKAVGTPKKFKERSRTNLLASVFQKKSFDIIHFEFSALAVVYKDVLNLLNAVTVVSCRGTAEKVKPLTTPGRKELLAEVFNKVDSIHCVSEDMSQTITPFCQQPQKIFVNRPSIDITYFNRQVSYQPASRISILSVGRFTFQKGYLSGLLAVKKLKDQGIDFTWQIVGEGPLLEEMIFHIYTLHLQDHVVLLGKKNKEEVFTLYQQADIFLLSSVYEGIANVVLEAMAMQLPVVATKSGGLEEVIESGLDGILTEVYDHDAISNALSDLCCDFEKRLRIGKKARQKIIAQFTIERQTDEFEAVYSALVKNKIV